MLITKSIQLFTDTGNLINSMLQLSKNFQCVSYILRDDLKEANLMVDVHVAQACNQNKADNLEQNWELKIAQWLLPTELIMGLRLREHLKCI